MIETEATSAADLIAAIDDGSKVALVTAPLGVDTIEDAFDSTGLKLLPITGWTDGGNLVKYPFPAPDPYTRGVRMLFNSTPS